MLLFHGSVPSSCRRCALTWIFASRYALPLSDSATTACMRVQPPCQPQERCFRACPLRNKSRCQDREMFHLEQCLIQSCHENGTCRPVSGAVAGDLLACAKAKPGLQ